MGIGGISQNPDTMTRHSKGWLSNRDSLDERD